MREISAETDVSAHEFLESAPSHGARFSKVGVNNKWDSLFDPPHTLSLDAHLVRICHWNIGLDFLSLAFSGAVYFQ